MNRISEAMRASALDAKDAKKEVRESLLAVAVFATVGLSWTGAVDAETSLQALARGATSANTSESNRAIAALRNQGQIGVDAFLAAYQDKLSPQQTKQVASSSNWRQVSKVLDKICKQRDCYASRLFWYTDLEQAKTAAKATGKPILSLRLLGNLDEDLSCANSRFFRIALYPNAEVSKLLRDRFILHWQSVRPVPKVTIDFGDGRKLERTITGNSIHYILDAEGKPFDALPGLYSPQAFQSQLIQISNAVKGYSQKSGIQKEEFLKQYHRDRLAKLQANWRSDLSKLGISIPLSTVTQNSQNTTPTAAQAAPLAMSKMAVERPILSAISPNPLEVLKTATTSETWEKIAQLYRQETKLDANSKALMQTKDPQAFPSSNSEKIQRIINNFESLITLDTVRDEYLFHSQLHEWFINDVSTSDVNTLNEKVYAELFLTPSSDPWLGLLPSDTYTAIENNGMSK